MGSVIQKTAK
jgi:hypothetical protein